MTFVERKKGIEDAAESEASEGEDARPARGASAPLSNVGLERRPTTKSSLGLQQWGDSPMGDAVGTGGSGTAERAARISRGQTKQAEDPGADPE